MLLLKENRASLMLKDRLGNANRKYKFGARFSPTQRGIHQRDPSFQNWHPGYQLLWSGHLSNPQLG